MGYAWLKEFGNPEDPESFEYIKKYSPLHNIQMPANDSAQYPPVLVLAATHDDRVVQSHSLKYVAEMQYTIGGHERQSNPILMRVDQKTGHVPSKPLSLVIEEQTDILAFLAVLDACSQLEYPYAHRDNSVFDIYQSTKGEVEISDPYRWLEDGDREDTKEFINSQNNLFHEYISSNPERERIREKLVAMHNYPKSKTFGEDYELEVKVDLNKLLSQDPSTTTITVVETLYNRDATVLAYAWCKNGLTWSTINFLDSKTRQNLPDTLENVKSSTILWNGKEGIFYGASIGSTEPLKNQKLMYHRLGTNQSEDVVVFDYPENPFAAVAESTTFVNDEKTLLVSVSSDNKIFGQNALFTADLPENITGKLEFKPLAPFANSEYIVIKGMDRSVLVKTNLKASNWRVVKIHLDNRDESNWETVVEEHPTMPIDWVAVSKDKIVYSLLDNATSWIRIRNMTDGKTLVDRLPLERGTVSQYRFLGRDSILLKFETFTNPYKIYKLNFTEDVSKLQVYEEAQLINYDEKDFVTKEVFYNSYDGTTIHMFIIHKKTLSLDGTSFAILWGYGGYAQNMMPKFQPYKAVLLQSFNVVIAVPNLRGGGELGKDWHVAGMFKRKQKVFEDFQAAAEYLINHNYTTKSKLWIEGWSNGGLLIGACVNQRPDLFAAAVPHAGTMDMLRFHHFTHGPDWILEFGNPQDPEMFEYIRKYSPLHNIPMPENLTQQYPAMLVMTQPMMTLLFQNIP
ncbi:Prolyl endopeptidase [Orchesella cincta]|uniref:Prolyl endopeptidase n=1 Tax=Orchesella cincta TaxID=48709 RepID=A0A1D2M7M3_ORCCI|nr:Prolyl endopeptidase [Orchesella cincta]